MTGLRRGELCGLRWSDVDLDAARLNVRQTIVTVAGIASRVATSKSAHSRRTHRPRRRDRRHAAPPSGRPARATDARRAGLDRHRPGVHQPVRDGAGIPTRSPATVQRLDRRVQGCRGSPCTGSGTPTSPTCSSPRRGRQDGVRPGRARLDELHPGPLRARPRRPTGGRGRCGSRSGRRSLKSPLPIPYHQAVDGPSLAGKSAGQVVRPPGFEPGTCGLRVRCSAVELEARARPHPTWRRERGEGAGVTEGT